MRASLFFKLMCISAFAFAQPRVFIDNEKKMFTMEQIMEFRRADHFIARDLVKRTQDTILYRIQHYPKAEVAARFQSEGWYCGNNHRKSVDEILKDPFYSRVATVKLTAFNLTGQHELHYIPKKEDQIDVSLAKEVVTLNKEMTNKLLDLLANFSATDDIEVTFSDFDPRNAILFFDHAGKQIGNIEICFECWQLAKSPVTIPSGTFCSEAFDTLQGFFRSAGISYGTRVYEK